MAASPLRDRLRAIIERRSSTIKQAPERLAAPMDVALLDEIAGRIDEVHTALSTLVDLNQNMQNAKVQMSEINARLAAQVPQGFQIQRTVDVTSQLFDYLPPEPLFSVDLKNDGDNTVYYNINDATKEFVALNTKEGRTIVFNEAKIRHIYFRCNANETATVRVTGTF